MFVMWSFFLTQALVTWGFDFDAWTTVFGHFADELQRVLGMQCPGRSE